MPINIPFLADVRAFLRGTGDIEAGLEDVAGSLDGVADKAERVGDTAGRELAGGMDEAARDVDGSADKITRSLGDVGDEAERVGRDAGRELADGMDSAARDVDGSTEKIAGSLESVDDEAKTSADKLERSFRDAFDAVKGEARGASDTVASSTKGGTRDAIDATGEFKDEAKQNISEVASSFSGDMDSAVDVIQGTLGGLAANLGPAGLFGAAVLAGGIGLVKSVLEGNSEEAEALKERVIALADELQEVGGNTAALDWAQQLKDAAAEITDAASWWELWQDEPVTKLEEWAEAARNAGIDFGAFAVGMAGEAENAARAQDELTDRIAALREERDRVSAQTPDVEGLYSAHATGASSAVGPIDEEIAALEGLRDGLDQAVETTERASEYQKTFAEAMARVDDQARESVEAQEEYAEGVGDALAGAGEAWEQYTKDGITNLDEYNAAIEEQFQAVAEYEGNMVRASETLSTEALNYVRRLGPEAAPLLRAYVDAPLDQQERTRENWERLGRVATDGYASRIDGLAGETETAIAAAQRRANDRKVRVDAYLSSGNLQWQLNDAVSRIRPPTIPVYPRVMNQPV